MEPLPLPSSLEEVESLIQALYRPNSPETISRIQEVLQRLQKSPGGWKLAESLLVNPDDNIKFFGALTIIVKLNTESSALSEDDAKELLRNLIGWLLGSLKNGTGAVVIRKLCSALVAYFIHFSHLWTRCMSHLLSSLDLSYYAPEEEAEKPSSADEVIAKLAMPELQAAMWFAASLVEDTGKTDMNSPKYIQVHERLAQNAADVASLLGRGLSLNVAEINNALKVKQETLKCLQSWILYAQRTSTTTDNLVVPLRKLVEPALGCITHEELYESTAELFIDILSNYSGFLKDPHYQTLLSVLESTWAEGLYQGLLQGDFDFSHVQFGLLMIAYGDAKVQNLIESTDAHSQAYLNRLSGLLAAAGAPVGEDTIFMPALEFWSTFVETMTDSMYSDEETSQEWVPRAQALVMQVVANCWRKIKYPPVEEFMSWDSSERVGFGDARKDVSDLLQSVYALSGPSLISLFADLLLQSLPGQNWAELESAAFCLSALSDCISDDAGCDTTFSKVFASPLFELLGQAHGPIPLRLRQTGLSLIERYSDYFERNPSYLPAALNLLFAAVGDPVLGGPSSRSIASLCSSCRTILTGEVEAFLLQYQSIHNTQAIDSIVEERLVLAIASIIQAMPGEDQKLHALEQLLSFVSSDIEQALQLKTNTQTFNPEDPAHRRGMDISSTEPQSPDEVAQQAALRALRCLASAAKGMQAVSEAPVDVDANPRTHQPGEQLARIQDTIMQLIAATMGTFASSGEVVESVCNILRAGFPETEPGPFVFPPGVISDFFCRQTIATPRIGTLLSTACSFVGSLSKTHATDVVGNLSKLLPWVVGLLQALPDPDADTEVAENGIEFVTRLMAKHPNVLFGLQPTSSLEFFFLFSLRVLSGQEPLPKTAAANFWSGFLTLQSDDASVQASIGSAMAHLGPLLAQTLINNIGGNAARSELDKLSDPLKKLVVQQPRAQAWLEQALLGETFPSKQVSREDRLVFLKRIISLRGARQTNQIVREFWLASRGSSFAYAS